jgi:hypothetical protein
MPCPSHSSYLITRIVFGEQFRSWSSSLCSLFQCPLPHPSQAEISFLATPSSKTINCVGSFEILPGCNRCSAVLMCDWASVSNYSWNMSFNEFFCFDSWDLVASGIKI